MINRQILTGSVIGAATWIGGYLGTMVLADGMSAASAYAVLVGWWLTAYICATLTLPILAAVPLSVAYLALFFVAALSEQSLFYRDVSSLSLTSAMGIGVMQAGIIGSPILFDGLFRRIIRVCSRGIQ